MPNKLLVRERPIPELAPVIKKVFPDVIFVPIVAFDSRLYRIGYGGGYYDRTLAQLNAFTIGLCFEHGRSSKIVEERHDIPLDLIIVG